MDSDGVLQLLVGEVVFAEHVDVCARHGRVGGDDASQAAHCLRVARLLDLPSEVEVVPADDAVLDQTVAGSAISGSSFSAWVNLRGFPTATALVKRLASSTLFSCHSLHIHQS